MLTSLHVEGRTPLHRLSAGLKLGALALLGAGLFLVHTPWVLATALCLAALAYFTIGLPVRAALNRISPTLWSLAFLTAINLWLLPASEAMVLSLRFLVLILAAAAVTASTPLPQMMEAVDRLVSPLERAGWLRRGDAGLVLGLCMRFVPEIRTRYAALKEAHKARGIKIRFLSLLGPLIILTLRQADDVAAAIDARGLRAPARPSKIKRKQPE